MRIGDPRVLFSIEEGVLVVLIMKIGQGGSGGTGPGVDLRGRRGWDRSIPCP